MNRNSFLIAVIALASATYALAQVHSNAPTDKDYRLEIVSPNDGATISGTDLTVVLAQPRIPRGQSVKESERMDVMMPTFQVWLDGRDQGNLPAGQNVFVARGLSYGPHKIVVAAKNTAGEIVDRKEISVTTVTAATVQVSQTDQVQPAVAPPPPAPAPAVAPPPAPEPELASPPPPPSAPLTSLPQTATQYPTVAVSGLGLLLGGLALSRRRRNP